MAFHRSDYMIHSKGNDEVALQQVELNTISAAFPSLSSLVSHLHKYKFPPATALTVFSSLLSAFNRFLISRFHLSAVYPAYELPEGNSQNLIARLITRAHVEYKNPEYEMSLSNYYWSKFANKCTGQ